MSPLTSLRSITIDSSLLLSPSSLALLWLLLRLFLLLDNSSCDAKTTTSLQSRSLLLTPVDAFTVVDMVPSVAAAAVVGGGDSGHGASVCCFTRLGLPITASLDDFSVATTGHCQLFCCK